MRRRGGRYGAGVLDVTPAFPLGDSVELGFADAKFFHDRLGGPTRTIAAPNVSHLFLSELDHAMIFAFGSECRVSNDVAAFGHHVTHIIPVSPRPKVSRIYTDGIVACVANAKPLRKGAVGQFKADPSSLIGLPTPRKLRIGARHIIAPRPALVRLPLMNARPERALKRAVALLGKLVRILRSTKAAVVKEFLNRHSNWNTGPSGTLQGVSA